MTAPSYRHVAIWLAVVIGVCFMGSIGGTYHFDDSHSVQDNLAVRSLWNIPSYWTDPKTSSFVPENRVYRPLVYTFYAFCWLVGNGETWPFHLMKMVMHLMVCLALFSAWKILWQYPGWWPSKNLKISFPLISHVFTLTPGWAAFFLATLFAVHPACSECVDYISATTSLQCALFYAWAFVQYLHFRESKGLKGLGLSLFLYFCSVASKEEGITLPAMILMTEAFLTQGKFWNRLTRGFKQTLPYGMLAIGLAGWIFVMHPTEGNESRGFATPMQYFMTQWRAYLWYMRLWFWPWDLNADVATMEFSKSLTDPLVIQAAIGNLLILGLAWINRRRFPAFLYGLIWFYVTISPASSVVVLAEAINEHRMYLSYFGFVGGSFTLLAAMAEWLGQENRSSRLGWLYVAVIVGLFVGSQERNRVWANDENLWADTVEKNPTSGRALNNLALVYMAQGRYKAAVEKLQKCEQYWNSYMYCPLNKGIALREIASGLAKKSKPEEAQKIYGQAEAALRWALQLNPRSVHTNFHLAKFLKDVRNDCQNAVGLFQTSVNLTGGRYPAADYHLGECLVQLGRKNEAIEAVQRGLSLVPDDSALHELQRRIASMHREAR